MSESIVEIDGSLLEGGGQIIRNALSLSCLTQKSIKITNIRSRREKPGLMEQHLKGLELLTQICNAKVQGAAKGSTTIEFYPNKLQSGNFNSLVKTAGSVCLILQVALPCCLFTSYDVILHLEGGTNCEMAPQIDFMTEVFRPNLEKMGGTFDLDLIRRGYFPRGGGSVNIKIEPIQCLNPILLENSGDVCCIYGWCFAAGRSRLKEAEEISESAKEHLSRFQQKVDIEVYHEDKKVAPIGDCSGIILVAETTTGCILGGSALKKRSECPSTTGQRAAEELSNSLQQGICVDSYTQDQLIIFMALATGKSRIKVGSLTMHTKTAIAVAEALTAAKFHIKDCHDHHIIECDGIAFRANHT